MYDDKYHFITFTPFSGLLSGFGFEIVIPEPDPIRILGLVFRSEPDLLLVKDQIGLSGTLYSSTSTSEKLEQAEVIEQADENPCDILTA